MTKLPETQQLVFNLMSKGCTLQHTLMPASNIKNAYDIVRHDNVRIRSTTLAVLNALVKKGHIELRGDYRLGNVRIREYVAKGNF